MTVRFVLPLLACALLHSGAALAGTELQVYGSIYPRSCSMTLGNGGAFDYGSIAHGGKFAKRTTPLTIDCQFRTPLGIRIHDNRADEVPGSDAAAFGLRASGGMKTGTYHLIIDNTTAEGHIPLALIRRDAGQEGWVVASFLDAVSPSATYSWSFPASAGIPAYAMQHRIEIATLLELSEDRDRGREMELDGSATVELVYL